MWIHSPFGETLAASMWSDVLVLLLFGVDRTWLLGEGVCHSPPSCLRSWLFFDTLYSWSVEF